MLRDFFPELVPSTQAADCEVAPRLPGQLLDTEMPEGDFGELEVLQKRSSDSYVGRVERHGKEWVMCFLLRAVGIGALYRVLTSS